MKIVSVFSADSYTMPAVVSVSLHLLLLIIVTWGWEAAPPEPRVHTPRFVQATLVELTAKSPAPAAQPPSNVVDMRARQQEQQRQEAERRRQQEQRQARERQAQEERERQAKVERDRQAQAERERQAKAEQERKAQAERDRQAQEQRQAQERLDAALQQEEEFFEAQQSQTLAQSYMAQIAARIEQNWSRPPSARTGMECELLIQLVPTGRVVNVTIARSSGNAAFDRSAEQAVKRVEQFTEVQNMPSELFERNFRQLRLVFKPGDLRL